MGVGLIKSETASGGGAVLLLLQEMQSAISRQMGSEQIDFIL
jgi:hypothetical protein